MKTAGKIDVVLIENGTAQAIIRLYAALTKLNKRQFADVGIFGASGQRILEFRQSLANRVADGFNCF